MSAVLALGAFGGVELAGSGAASASGTLSVSGSAGSQVAGAAVVTATLSGATGTSVSFSLSPSVSGAQASCNAGYTSGSSYTLCIFSTASGSTQSIATYGQDGTPPLPAGTYTVTARVRGGTGAGDSASATFTVGSSTPTPDTTATSLSLSPTSITAGGSVSLTAGVTDETNGGTTVGSGSVQFQDVTDGVNLGTSTISSGSASITVSNFSQAGTYEIEAIYEGDSAFAQSTSGAVALTVQAQRVPDSTSTRLSLSASSITAGQSVTLSSVVTDTTSGGDVESGTVQFELANGTTLGSPVAYNSSTDAYSMSVNTFSQAGTYTIQAVFSGDGVNGSTSGSQSLVVNAAAAPSYDTTTSLSISPTTITAGSSATLTAKVTDASGSPVTDGNVQFWNTTGTTRASLGTAPLDSGGVATLTPSVGWASGTDSVEADYLGDLTVGYAESNGSASLSVVPSVGTSSLSVSVSPSVVVALANTSITLRATVTPSAAFSGSGESVGFTIGGKSIGNAPIDTATGVASLTTAPNLAAGSYTITASYGGDASNGSSTGTTTLYVAPATSISVTANPSATTAGSSVTLSATVSPYGAPASGSESVRFTAGGSALCSGTLVASGGSASASCTTSALPAGTQTVTASYAGDDSNGPSTGTATVIVESLSASATPASTKAGSPVTLSATLVPWSGSPGPNEVVRFSSGSTALCSAPLSASGANGAAQCSTSALGVGNDTITASYTSDGVYASVSAVVFETVTPLQQTTTLSASAAPSPTTSGTNVTFSALLSPWSPPASGSEAVSFAVGGTALCSATVSASGSNGSASCASTALPVGTDTVTASYAGDSDYASAATVFTTVVVPGIISCFGQGGYGYGAFGGSSGSPSCDPSLLSGASPPAGVWIGQGSSVNLSVDYDAQTPIGSGAAAPVAVLYSGFSIAGLLNVSEQSIGGSGDPNREQLSVSVPSTLAPGIYFVQLTAYDSSNDVDQYTWSVWVVPQSPLFGSSGSGSSGSGSSGSGWGGSGWDGGQGDQWSSPVELNATWSGMATWVASLLGGQ